MEHLFINTKATNVELTDERMSLIRKRLASITRVLRQAGGSELNVVIRGSSARDGSVMYFVSLKAIGEHENFMAVAAKPHLGLALSAAAHMLRQAMSRGESVTERYASHLTPSQFEAFTLTL
ncbi:hypothetical protein KC722_00275 [Candidatus Kaiserbacteria bacterium]|nr:hypothetical protein [Candidatus Kaiserbacteria bacterium]MCB9811968.1 hypothetical protein [Candidatus Nomurabacteria bacterium]